MLDSIAMYLGYVVMGCSAFIFILEVFYRFCDFAWYRLKTVKQFMEVFWRYCEEKHRKKRNTPNN